LSDSGLPHFAEQRQKTKIHRVQVENKAGTVAFAGHRASDFREGREDCVRETCYVQPSGAKRVKIEEITIRSLGELIDMTTPNEPDPASGRLRDNSVYRGMPDKDWRLLSSLDRLGGAEQPHAKAHLEEHLLRNFVRFGKPFLPKQNENIWELMCIAEHHGLPTRLLDWTHSPLVAAHFATLNRERKNDRVIWRLNWQLLHEHFGLRTLSFLVEDLEALLRERGYDSGWDFIAGKIPRRKRFACLLEPPAFTERLSVQSGAFTVASVKNKTFDAFLHECGLRQALSRFVIPADRVGFVRDQLDLATVSERRLFPGLDGISAELKRYYAASGDDAAE
jgi:hypothetical protein